MRFHYNVSVIIVLLLKSDKLNKRGKEKKKEHTY